MKRLIRNESSILVLEGFFRLYIKPYFLSLLFYANRVIYIRSPFNAGTPSCKSLFSQEEEKMAIIVYIVIILVCLLFAALSLVTMQEHR